MRKAISVLEYVVAGLLLIGGINTTLQVPGDDPSNIFALVFDNHISLILFGITFFLLGGLIIYGRVQERINVRLAALMTVYCLMTFATLADMLLVGFTSLVWLDSVIIGLAAAYAHAWEARWKAKNLGKTKAAKS